MTVQRRAHEPLTRSIVRFALSLAGASLIAALAAPSQAQTPPSAAETSIIHEAETILRDEA